MALLLGKIIPFFLPLSFISFICKNIIHIFLWILVELRLPTQQSPQGQNMIAFSLGILVFPFTLFLLLPSSLGEKKKFFGDC